MINVRWNGGSTFNLVTNPSFESSGTTGWTTFGTWATNTRDTTKQRFGDASCKLVNSSGSDALKYFVFTATATTHTISIWIFRESGSANIDLILQENFGAFNLKATTTISTTTGIWQRWTASASSLTIGQNYRLRVTSASGNTFYIDGAQAEVGAEATPYYDGEWGDETPRSMGLRTNRGRDHMLQPDGKGVERQRVGVATLTLENHDRRYDPYYASSPLYPNVAPGRDVQIRVTDGATIWNAFRGRIDDLVPFGAEKQVRVVVKDGWEWLEQREIRYATQADLLTDEALDLALTAAEYPSAWGTSLEIGDDTIPYWWASNENAADAVRALADSEFGILYVAANGAVTYIARTSLYNATAALTLTQEEVLQDIAVPRPWEILRNIANVTIHPQVAVTFQTLWTLNEVLFFQDDEERVFWAKLTYDSKPAALIPGTHGGVSFSMNTQADGGGTGIGDPTITTENFGTLVKITVTNNNSLNLAGYLTSLSFVGNAVYVPDEHTVEDDASSGSAYGPRVIALDLPWQQDSDRAYQFARYLTSLFGDSRIQPQVKMENRPTIQFAYDLATAVQFESDYMGIDNLMRVMGIEHEWLTPNGQRVQTIWHLEPVDETVYWILGTSELDTETILAF